MKKLICYFVLILTLLVSSCNLPISAQQDPAVPATALTGSGVQILFPLNATQINSTEPLEITYIANGGPFIEVNLLVDGQLFSSQPITAVESSVNGTLLWDTHPPSGEYDLEVQLVTNEKNIYTDIVTVFVAGGPTPEANGQGKSIFATPTFSIDGEAARQKVVQILKDRYGIHMSSPAIGRKSREGVTSDPWVSATYFNDWFINISLYPDGTESVYAAPLNGIDPDTNPTFTMLDGKPSKLTHYCKPAGTIKLLVVFLDYQNTNISQQEAFDGLTQAVNDVNQNLADASRSAGVSSPILQIQVTAAHLSPPPPDLTTNRLLSPDLVRRYTSYDPSNFDLLVQVDLDAGNTVANTYNQGSHGFAGSGCGGAAFPPFDVDMWIGIDRKEALGTDPNIDARFSAILGHELLHTMGYPIGKTGLHEWICWDGTQVDATDQCDQTNLPVYMLGWTDTDGDGVVEILDTTPYGYLPP